MQGASVRSVMKERACASPGEVCESGWGEGEVRAYCVLLLYCASAWVAAGTAKCGTCAVASLIRRRGIQHTAVRTGKSGVGSRIDRVESRVVGDVWCAMALTRGTRCVGDV